MSRWDKIKLFFVYYVEVMGNGYVNAFKALTSKEGALWQEFFEGEWHGIHTTIMGLVTLLFGGIMWVVTLIMFVTCPVSSLVATAIMFRELAENRKSEE